MIRMLSAFVCGMALLAFAAPSFAEEKEETLKGEITCAKCGLKIDGQTKCATVIKVGEKVYWFDAKADKDNHKAICTEAKKGTVKGTVKKDGDKMIVTVKEVKFD
jgi:hypothetical protein